MPTDLRLAPELERFAAACVAGGRYGDVGEVVSAGLRLLMEAEERRQAFGRMLDEVRAESERDGWVSADEALAEMDAIIGAAEAKAR